MMDEGIFRIVEQAEGYPYDLREDAFVFKGGLAAPLEEEVDEGRTPVLAIGSNGAPSRLANKFGASAVVPVKPAQLRDHAVVYAAAVTSYGSVPATLLPVAGATALVAITYLDDDQLRIMNRSERLGQNYELIDIAGQVTVDDAPIDQPVLGYRSLYGPLLVNGQPVRLAEVPTVGTPFGAAYQSGMLALLHHRFAREGEIYAAFIGDLVVSESRRLDIVAALSDGVPTTRQTRRVAATAP